jgi:hypothetical protein
VFRDETAHVVAQLFAVALELLRRQAAGRQRRVAPDAELRPVGDRDAEQLADHRDRDGQRIAVDEVGGRAGRLHVRDQPGRQRSDPRPEQLDAPHGERLRDQRPQPRVVGWVHLQDAAVPLHG